MVGGVETDQRVVGGVARCAIHADRRDLTGQRRIGISPSARCWPSEGRGWFPDPRSPPATGPRSRRPPRRRSSSRRSRRERRDDDPARRAVPLRRADDRRSDVAPRPRGRAGADGSHVPCLRRGRGVQRRAGAASLLRAAGGAGHGDRRQRGGSSARRPPAPGRGRTSTTSCGNRPTMSAVTIGHRSTSPSAASVCAIHAACTTVPTLRPPRCEPDDVDWDHLFGELGVRWLHTGGIFAGLSESTFEVARVAMARRSSTWDPWCPMTSTIAPACGRREGVPTRCDG